MPIAANEIKYYHSTNKLGGQITGTEVLSFATHDLFDLVDGVGSLEGETNYRCIYVKNTNSTLEFLNAAIHLLTGTTLSTTDLHIGLGTSIVGGVEQSIVLETDNPIGVTFTNVVGESGKLTIGNVPKGSHKAIWLKRVVSANSSGFTGDQVTLRVKGESSA
jgi:hypothetical protein